MESGSGVNGVTQCPIKPGDSYTYEWMATQYGHSWYHRLVDSLTLCIGLLADLWKPLLYNIRMAFGVSITK